ncbi:sphinganine C4-monooxygenase 2-like [Phoenix dactylifera]|uniref:aldehyde oxygenase (deformylating) n=1 Tax=Phoenix dactylifera TaxID=42345 RepID=A0A8B9A980_PHODC|nr:sphinganine C4-monooxygenase 2-like [Phoenix dactylifera]XP_038979078.1 sphinganine C4-monooxygenase 2-like [Phoenix dactylifera]XP_038983180.1 sphinganine C4-monooxygenase 2-like [Phoenix dactylifera]
MMAFELSDEVLGTFVPIVVYWVFSGIYGLLGYLENYRLHPKGAEEEKNLASKGAVLKGVLLQQAVQIAVVFLMLKFISDESGVPKPQPSLLVMAWQFLIAMVVLDSWQYFGHRYMHVNKFLYKHIHSTHHALIVPYAYGALYNNPLEGLILDTIGGSLAFLLSGMTPRTGIYFFSFATIKTVDVHCGLWFPWNPLQWFFNNNCAYHDIHHQLRGNKYNFAQPFFVAWDKILGTHMPFVVEERKGGGFEARPVKY